jgi:autotransporter-associated beta strand protein
VGAATSTDRQINIGNTTTGTGGGVIENNGSGTLTFSRATFNNTQGTVTANRTLTLGGTNNGVIAGAIQNNNAGALISLVKKDAGTWTLNGTNTYTGTTTVNAGKLLINGSTHTNSTLTVSTNATLGGSGTIGGATTISGTHSPGNSPGIQTFSSNLTYTNSANVLWELTANTTTQGSPAPVFDQIVVGGNLDFASPTTLTLNFNYTGSTVDWSNALWKSDISGAAGWLLYDVSGTLSNFTNLSIVTENWVDASGTLFNTALSGSSFSLYQEGNDIYLNYAVPEPSTYAMLVLSAAGLGAHVIRRRRRGC